MFLRASKPLLILAAGGLIVLSLCLRRWTVSHCVEVFDILAKKFFQQRWGGARYSLGYIRNVIKCWLSDGCYNVLALEASLKDQFGHDGRMFDKPESVSGMKVAVIATSISDATPFLFSNYNGSSIRAAQCGKPRFKHISLQTLRLHAE